MADQSLHEAYTGVGGILDALTAPVFALDRDFRYTAFNEAHAAVMRRAYGAEIEIGADALAFPAIPLDGELERESLEAALRGESVVSKAWVGPESDRRFFWSAHSPILDGDEVVGVAMISQDLTEHELALEAKARLAAVVESSEDAIVSASLDGTILAWNPGAERLYGVPAHDMIGRSFASIATPEHLPVFQGALDAVAGGEAVQHLTTEFHRADGQRVVTSVVITPVLDDRGTIIGAASIAHDITHRQEAQEVLARHVRSLRTLGSVNEALVRSETEEDLLATTCQVIARDGDYVVAWVGYPRFDPAKSIRVMATSEGGADILAGLSLTWAGGQRELPAGRAFREGKPVFVQDTELEEGSAEWREPRRAARVRSVAALPLMGLDGAAFGVLVVASAEPDVFDPDQCAVLEEIAADLSYGIETHRARQRHAEQGRDLIEANYRLNRIVRDITEVLGSVVEARDPYTHGHELAVARLSRALAEEMHLTQEDIDGLEIAALLHDVGKLSVPAEILTKPGELSATEFALVKEHPTHGHQILERLDFGWPVAEVVLQHHERLDGSGYPDGLVGDEISLGARILAVADVVEAMSNHRPYREALGIDAAIKEVQSHPEKFDARVVAVCVHLYDLGAIEV